MTSTMPIRVDGELFDVAKSVGATSSRSAAQQLSHWARIGRELEAAPAVRLREIQRVLSGEGEYDELSERAQAVVRANWDEQIAERAGDLNLAAEFVAAGRPWIEADAEGRARTIEVSSKKSNGT